MNLADIRTKVVTMLGATATILPNADIDQAVDSAVAVLSRFFPRERTFETTFSEDVTDEAWTSAATHGTDVSLANKPVRFGSETITSSPAGTTYKRDTDYRMNYIDGKIRTISGGGMGLSTAFLATYKRDGVVIDLGTNLTEPIAIQTIDVLSVDEVPRELESWEVFGDFLFILTSDGDKSQNRVANNAHIRIYYLGHHDEPIVGANGSYPAFLDQLVLVGVSGYLMLTEAAQQEHQSITDLASARTSIANIAAIHTALATIVTSLATANTNAKTALDTVSTDIKGATLSMQTALASATTELASATTELGRAKTEIDKYDVAVTGPVQKAKDELGGVGAMLTSAETALGKVDTNITLAKTALDKVDTDAVTARAALVKVDTHLVGASNTAQSALNKVATRIDTDADAALDKVNTRLTSTIAADRSADLYLDTGDALINTVNTGGDAPGENRKYAEVAVSIARAHIEEAMGRYNQALAFIQESIQRIATSQTFVAEANGREAIASNWVAEGSSRVATSLAFVQEASGRLTEAERKLSVAAHYLAIADRHLESGNRFTDNARIFVSNGAEYVAIATGRYQQMLGFLQEATGRLTIAERLLGEYSQRVAQIAAYLDEARVYQSSAIQQRDTANLMRIEGNERLASFFRALEDRTQISTHRSTASVRQYAGQQTSQYGGSWNT